MQLIGGEREYRTREKKKSRPNACIRWERDCKGARECEWHAHSCQGSATRAFDSVIRPKRISSARSTTAPAARQLIEPKNQDHWRWPPDRHREWHRNVRDYGSRASANDDIGNTGKKLMGPVIFTFKKPALVSLLTFSLFVCVCVCARQRENNKRDIHFHWLLFQQ